MDSRAEKPSVGPRRRPVNGLNGPTGKEPQAPSAWAIAVGLSSLTLRAPVAAGKASGIGTRQAILGRSNRRERSALHVG